MKKLLIVDDEPVMLKGLRVLTDFDKLGIKIIGEALNGEEAIKLMKTETPDIILTDIWMPVMDGIELIKHVNKNNIKAKVIVLSGYSEFEYAKQSMKHGALDYLLKPVDGIQLAEALKKAIELINKEEQEYAKRMKELTQLMEGVPLLKDKFFQELLHGSLTFEKACKKADSLGLKLNPAEFSVLAVSINNYENNPVYKTEEDKKLLIFAVHNIVDEIISSENLGFTGTVDRQICCILNPGEDNPGSERIVKIAERIRESVFMFLKQPLTIGISRTYSSIENIPMAYSEACDAIKSGNGSGNSGIIAIEQIKQYAVADKGRISTDDIISQVKTYIEINFNSDLSLNEIANMVYINPSYFSTVFKNKVGENLVDYITRIRMEHARKLLISGDYKIYEVAEMVGYHNVRYFNEVFRKYYKKSPSDFKAYGTKKI